jgi:hypothetical protein
LGERHRDVNFVPSTVSAGLFVSFPPLPLHSSSFSAIMTFMKGFIFTLRQAGRSGAPHLKLLFSSIAPTVFLLALFLAVPVSVKSQETPLVGEQGQGIDSSSDGYADSNGPVGAVESNGPVGAVDSNGQVGAVESNGQVGKTEPSGWALANLSPQAWTLIGLSALLAIVAVLFASGLSVRKRLTELADEESPPIAPPLRESQAREASLPSAIFPGSWFEGLDQERLEDFFRRTRRSATSVFFEALEIDDKAGASRSSPTEAKLTAAGEKTNYFLNQALSSEAFVDLASGEVVLSVSQRALLKIHLEALVPPLRTPRPQTLTGEVRPAVLAVLASVGAIAGNVLGAGLLGWLKQPPETGALLGSLVGAALSVRLSLFLAQNERLRRLLLASVGGMALLDVLSSFFAGAMGPIFAGSSAFSPLRRLLFYGGAIAALILVKSRELFDVELFRRQTDEAVDARLSISLPLAVVLIHRIRKGEITQKGVYLKPSEDVSLIQDVAAVVKRLRAKEGLEDDPVFSELCRKLNNAGYETDGLASAGRQILWDEEAALKYDSFGLVRKGQALAVEEEPIVKDGQVVKKGLAVPK